MFAFVITIHIIACALLILIVLIQQGRGGGLVDSLSSAESIFGTKTNAFLIKSTSILAVIFFITCLTLAFLSIQKNKSLIETLYKPTTAESGTAGKTTPEKTPNTQATQTQTALPTNAATATQTPEQTTKPAQETAAKPVQ